MKAELDPTDKTDPAPASPVKDSRPVGAPADHPTADDSALVTPPDGTWVDTVARQYARILQAFGPPNPARYAAHQSHARTLLEALAATDPIEQMLASQLLFAQARIQFLSGISVTQKDPVWSQIYNAQLDRATAAYYKLLEAVRDHRRPRRRGRGKSFTSIRTAHITAQQVIGLSPPAAAILSPTEAPHANPTQPQFSKAQPQAAQGPSPPLDSTA